MAYSLKRKALADQPAAGSIEHLQECRPPPARPLHRHLAATLPGPSPHASPRTLMQIGHAGEGGLYAEMVQVRSPACLALRTLASPMRLALRVSWRRAAWSISASDKVLDERLVALGCAHRGSGFGAEPRCAQRTAGPQMAPCSLNSGSMQPSAMAACGHPRSCQGLWQKGRQPEQARRSCCSVLRP